MGALDRSEDEVVVVDSRRPEIRAFFRKTGGFGDLGLAGLQDLGFGGFPGSKV